MVWASAVLPVRPPTPLRERALDLVFPPVCAGCRRVGEWICGRCWSEVEWLVGRCCRGCGAPSAHPLCPSCAGVQSPLQSTCAAATFGGVSREAIHHLKYEGHHAISGLLGRLMAQIPLGAGSVAHVPLHPARRRERGYDQAFLLARSLARAARREQITPLSRIRRTEQQASLNASERRHNVRGAFTSRPCSGHVLLVDDVATTGATLEAAADALLAAGAEAVTGVVFARVL